MRRPDNPDPFKGIKNLVTVFSTAGRRAEAMRLPVSEELDRANPNYAMASRLVFFEKSIVTP